LFKKPEVRVQNFRSRIDVSFRYEVTLTVSHILLPEIIKVKRNSVNLATSFCIFK
jgi:hypothetical protein